MNYIPRLYTPRLCLRPFTLEDALRVQHLAGDRRIAAVTARIPYPYPDGAAESWIAAHGPAAERGEAFDFAITLTGTRTPGRENDPADTGHVVGAVGVIMAGEPGEARAALGYWIGTPYWNKGFATEAARAVVDFAFSRRHLHRLTADHLAVNEASGRVMQKLGMVREGVLRSHISKWGEYHDLVCYGLLRTEWESRYLHRTRRYVATRPLPPAVAFAAD
jgi:RimJ/RimL family protein N-acetyltransferase